jgi:hypothetical protein
LETKLVPDHNPRFGVTGGTRIHLGDVHSVTARLFALGHSALVWNRTSTSWASARRHHQIGYEGIVVAGVVPGHEHRRYSVVREHTRRATNRFGDEDSNLDEQDQSLPACH